MEDVARREQRREGLRFGEESEGGTGVKRDKGQAFTLYAFGRVGDVVQGDVRPHVSAHFSLEGHPEGRRVGQDDIGVGPLVAVVTSGCPHQEAGAAGSGGVDLVGCTAIWEV